MRFEKVSFEQFKEACINCGLTCDDSVLQIVYDSIKLPQRSTTGSGAYDFYSPFDVHLPGIQISMSQIITANVPPLRYSKEYTTVPTGVRFVPEREDVMLLLLPRSGLGTKYGVSIRNTTGVIDSDYCQSDNEGHIFAVIGSEIPVDIEAGKAFMQGIIINYLTVDDEDKSLLKTRNGGFGSTDKKQGETL